MRTAIFIFCLILLVGVVSAESFVFQQNENVNYRFRCFNTDNSYCPAGTNCQISIEDPKGENVYDNSSMTWNSTYINHTLPTTMLGQYKSILVCTNNATAEFTYLVTPTGTVTGSILNNPLPLIFLILALVLLGMGMTLRTPSLGFIGSIMFLLSGLYVMIYGFDAVTNFYTRGVGVTFLGMGLFFMVISAYEWAMNEQ